VIRLAVFDLDGTLVDSLEDLWRAVGHALAVVGLPARSLAEVRAFVGEGAARLVGRAVAPHPHLADPALRAWRAHYQEHLLDHTRLFPGMADVLASAPCALAVHTNKPGAMARRILEGLGVLGRFAAVIGGDEAPRKPDPTGTLGILARLSVPPAEALLVGDSAIDCQTASSAGIRFVAVTWGLGSAAELEAAGARSFARDTSELLPWLAGERG
jgi:phosphoglycolate phosphatase